MGIGVPSRGYGCEGWAWEVGWLCVYSCAARASFFLGLLHPNASVICIYRPRSTYITDKSPSPESAIMNTLKARIAQLKEKLSPNTSGATSGSTGAGKTVLIDGATCFVATPIIMEFLEHGYKVRAQVRSESSADKVRDAFPDVGEDQLEFVIVKDIEAEGAYKDAVKGVIGVLHLASPFLLQVEDNERDLLQPAIRGTEQVLESVHKYGPDVKRVVITSSFSSIIDIPKGNRPGTVLMTQADCRPDVAWVDNKVG